MKFKVYFIMVLTGLWNLVITPDVFARPDEFELIRNQTDQRQDVSTALYFFDFKEAVVRFREVLLSESATTLSVVKTGDLIQLNLFTDLEFQAEVQNAEEYFAGNLTIIAKLTGFEYAFMVISTTENRSLVNIFIPELGKRFQIISDPVTNVHYLLELNPALIPEPEDHPPLIPEGEGSQGPFVIPPREKKESGTSKEPMVDAVIDIMIVYTPAARTWGNNNGGGILNCVATAVAIGKTVHANSQTQATNRLVYTAEVSYTENSDPEVDLNRFTGTSDGYMDGIHTWRNTYGADLCQLFTTMGGGIGWVLGNSAGDAGTGFSCVGVGTYNAFSPIHEMGHNMGCGHHKQQNFQPGPGLFSFSAGWRWWGSDGILYSSTMSYSDGSYFPPNYQSSTRVGYFSNPTINFMGAPTGDYDDGDNAWTITTVRNNIAAYRATATISCITCPGYDFELTPTQSWNTHSSSTVSYGCKMYRIEVAKGRTYTFQTGCGNGATATFDTYLNLYDNNCDDITYNDDGCESNRSKITWMATYDGYVYLKVKGYNAYFGSYTLAYQRSDILEWTGAASTNWNNEDNWNGDVIPDASFDVLIPTGATRQPYVFSANATCRNLTVNSGAILTIGGYTLTANENVSVSGAINMNNAAGVFNVMGDISWNSGATSSVTALAVCNVYGTWEFNPGSNVNLTNGIVSFRGATSNYIRCYSTSSSFYKLSSYKSGGAETGISSWSTQPLTINDDLYVHSGAIFGIFSDYDVTIKGDVNSNGTFICNAGKVILDGVSQFIRMNVGDYFRNLTFSQTGTVTIDTYLSNVVEVKYDVVIQSGVLNLADRIMKVGGNWYNNVGTTGFTEGTSRVIFNGAGHQYIKTSETFNIIEANMGAALRVDNAASMVTCNTYDWTSGGIDVVAGTFKALDLVDNGLYGTYWCNPGGTLDLTQNVGQYTDLNGEIHMFGGTMFVRGGSGASYWPYAANAVVEMSGGVLDFKDNGINIYATSFTLTENITGGTIKTNGSFYGNRTDFSPSGGTIELYGGSDMIVSHGVGSNLVNLKINKSAAKDDSGSLPEEKFYDRNGKLIETGKANTINANSDLVLLGGMTIQNGTLVAPSSIKLKGNWTNYVGTAGFTEGTGMVTFNNNNHQYCYGETFYGLELNMALMDLHIPAGTTTTCQIYDWNSGELEVEGGTFIAYDLFDNGLFGTYYLTSAGGLIELHQDASQFVDLCGGIVIMNGTMNVYGGNGYSYWPWNVNGTIWMSGGTLDFIDNGIWIYNSGLALDDDITGGTIRASKGFIGQRGDFTPGAGTFEFYGSGDYSISQMNGCKLHDVKINKSAKDGDISLPLSPEIDKRSGMQLSDGGKSNTISLGSDFTITGDLNIYAGIFSMSTYKCTVTGTTDIYGHLIMTSILNDITSGTINWNNGSTENVTSGQFHSYYWRFNDGTAATLGTGNTAYVYELYYPTDSDAEFGNLVATPYSKLTDGGSAKAYYPIRVAGNFTLQTGASWYLNVATTDLLVAGNSLIQSGANLYLQLADFNTAGALDISGYVEVDNGSVVTADGDFTFPSTGWLDMNVGSFTCNYNNSSGFSNFLGRLSMTTSSLIEFPGRSVSIGPSFINDIAGGTLKFGRTFGASLAGTFHMDAGTLEFISTNSGHYIQVINGNYVNDLILNKPSGNLGVYDNLIIKGDLTINDGTLNSNNKTISIAGDWTNNVGTSGFTETNGRVIFNGSGTQFCSSEDFYTLEINKPSYLYNVSYSDITCQIYDWTSGGLWISPGTFTAADLADNGLFGAYGIFNGTMDLHQGTDQYININGSLTIGVNGNLNIYGGSNICYWGFAGNVAVNMAAGTLDVKDQGILVDPIAPYTLTENITGGVIRTTGAFVDRSGTFTPTAGTIELYGSPNANLVHYPGSSFHNVVINKSDTYKDNIPNITSIARGNPSDEILSNPVSITSDLTLNGNLTVQEGVLFFGSPGYEVICMGHSEIQDGGTLVVTSNSALKLNNTMSVRSGGLFRSLGTAGQEALVTRAATNYYTFTVFSGGNLESDYTIFEYMGANGINLASGAVVHPAYAFNNCTFRNGLSGNTLLTCNNSQELISTGAIFPANTWTGASNVSKTQNAGRITFKDYSGAFSGQAFENDPFSRVDWFVPQLSATPTNINVTPPAGITTFNITSNIAWTITEAVSWLSVAPASGSNNATITITYDQNASTLPRSGVITLSGSGVPNVTVTVNQAGATLSVAPASRSVSATAGTTTFDVTSNTTWSVSESVSWFSVAPANGTGNATLTVTYDQNTSVSPRSGSIIVSSPGLANVTVTVNQAGASVILTVTPPNRDVNAPAGTTTFSVTSNTGWAVSESVAWFSVLPVSGSGNGTLTVTYGENATGSTRSGNITVTATGGAPAVTVSVTQVSYPVHQVSLIAGWQGLSSYIMPVNNDIADVFAPLSAELIMANTLTGVYYPAGGVNTIVDWLSQSAYAVKMNSTATLPIIGIPESNKNYGLVSGWNLIPVICNTPVDVTSLFAGTNLRILRDVAGLGIYWPEYGINSLGSMLPGSAYYANMTSPGAVLYPANLKGTPTYEFPSTKFPDHPWNEVIISPSSHQIAIISQGMEGIEKGDVLGVFDENGNCFGVTGLEVTGKNQVITAYASDGLTSGKTGFADGNLMQFKVFRPRTGEVLKVEVQFDGRLPQQQFFAGQGLSAITSLKVANVGLNDPAAAGISIFPNPAAEKVTISGIAEFSTIEFCATGGSVVKSFENSNADQVSIDISDLSKGIYQLRFTGSESTVYKKLIKN